MGHDFFGFWFIHFILLICSHIIKTERYFLLPNSHRFCINSSSSITEFNEPLVYHQIILTLLSDNNIDPLHVQNLQNHSIPQSNRILTVCPGVLIQPSGRFVFKTFQEGFVLFWLLHARVDLVCPPPSVNQLEYVELEQWFQPFTAMSYHSGTVGGDQSRRRFVSKNSHELSQYNKLLPEKSIRLDCKGKANVAQHITLPTHNYGLLRRLRVNWSLNASAPASAVPNESMTKNAPTIFELRISSQMVYVGNFSRQRRHKLCEFFSGFWCHAAADEPTTMADQPASSTTVLPECVRISMRCDREPDCNLSAAATSVDLGNNNIPDNYSLMSRDERDCPPLSPPHEPHVGPTNSSDDRWSPESSKTFNPWTSKLMLIALIPVPIVLVCALVRICSQKRRLDDLVDGMDENPMTTTTTTDSLLEENNQPSATNLMTALTNVGGGIRDRGGKRYPLWAGGRLMAAERYSRPWRRKLYYQYNGASKSAMIMTSPATITMALTSLPEVDETSSLATEDRPIESSSPCVEQEQDDGEPAPSLVQAPEQGVMVNNGEGSSRPSSRLLKWLPKFIHRSDSSSSTSSSISSRSIPPSLSDGDSSSSFYDQPLESGDIASFPTVRSCDNLTLATTAFDDGASDCLKRSSSDILVGSTGQSSIKDERGLTSSSRGDTNQAQIVVKAKVYDATS